MGLREKRMGNELSLWLHSKCGNEKNIFLKLIFFHSNPLLPSSKQTVSEIISLTNFKTVWGGKLWLMYNKSDISCGLNWKLCCTNYKLSP